MNDPLNDLFDGDTGPVRTHAIAAPATYTPAVERFTENCPNCRGTGRYVRGRFYGNCFKCKGTGKMTFRNSSDTRAANRAKRIERQTRTRQADFTAWQAANPAEATWLVDTAARWPLAASLLDAVQKYGDLTEKQMAVIHNGMARDASRAEARAAREAATPAPVAINVTKLEQSFETAKRNAARPGQMGVMVKPIRLTSGDLTVRFTAGSGGSQWEGMIFAKTDEGKKLGSVKDGRFTPRFECTEAEKAAVLDCAQDPEKAAVAYGKAYSKCGICGRGLLNDVSIARGIGPICAERFGW